eukprot:5686315-Lingulodinium_polyedra.AAC.1
MLCCVLRCALRGAARSAGHNEARSTACNAARSTARSTQHYRAALQQPQRQLALIATVTTTSVARNYY